MKRTLVLAALALASLSCAAQSDDAARGGQLYEDTATASGNNALSSCTNCHGAVANRRIAVGGSAFANIDFDTAMTALVSAITNLSQMAQYRGVLALQDVRDLATYIADTPKTTVASLDFTASAVSTATAAQTVDLRHSVAPVGTLAADRVLNVTGVTIGGANAAQFGINSNACAGAALQASNTCRIGITFNSPDTAGKAATLTINLRQGTQNFSRTVALTGAVAVTSPPPGGGGSTSNDDGGGALGLSWLVALAAAIAALRRRA